jgi:hypothetical protein
MQTLPGTNKKVSLSVRNVPKMLEEGTAITTTPKDWCANIKTPGHFGR